MEKKREKIKFDKKKAGELAGFILFMLILFWVFCNITYLFRNTEYGRSHIVGIENENLDMVYIGGSAAFVYWQPLKAWNDCGFTSYLYATNNMQAENIKALIEEARKSQSPDLFVIDARPFQYYSDEWEEAGLRNVSDGMDLASVSRVKLISNYLSNRIVTDETDIASYYFDIAKYHTNTANLGNSDAWAFKDNNGKSPNKGWEWVNAYECLETPSNFTTDVRTELDGHGQEILVDLLEYCSKEELNVLFVVCPYYISRSDSEKYNTIRDYVIDYGFDYLNANEYYSEMGIDFSTDFYNINHVNLFGAEKYTEFLERYIDEKYDLPDHREDAEYSSWNEDFQRFQCEKEIHAETVMNLKIDYERGNEIAEQLREADILAEWNMIAQDSRYTLFLVGIGKNVWPQKFSDQKVLSDWQYSEECMTGIRVMSDAQMLASNAIDKASSVEGILDMAGNISYCVSEKDDIATIRIGEKVYFVNEQGINALVLDNNSRLVVETAIIGVEPNGSMLISRK